MSSIAFIRSELSAALARGVRQCVVVGSELPLHEAIKGFRDQSLRVFAVNEEQPSVSPVTVVPARFASEGLAMTLERSGFDKQTTSLFIWLGDAGYRTIDAVTASLAFIASLPKGSGVIFDYAVERTSLLTMAHTALDGLASRICLAGTVKYLIQPQAVAAMLRGFGFRQMRDLVPEEPAANGGHLVSAVV